MRHLTVAMSAVIAFSGTFWVKDYIITSGSHTAIFVGVMAQFASSLALGCILGQWAAMRSYYPAIHKTFSL